MDRPGARALDGIQIYQGGAAAQAWLERHRGQAWELAIALGFTDTALIPNISAAGKTPGDRRSTALADAEFLDQGMAKRPTRPLPPLTAGLSPVLLSRALLEATGASSQLINAGLAEPLTAPALNLNQAPARCLSTGAAMARTQVETLFELGLGWGERWPHPGGHRGRSGNFRSSEDRPWGELAPGYLVLGECVVGGTTTALALLVALGIPALGRVNSSHSPCNHGQKAQLVALGLARSGLGGQELTPGIRRWMSAQLPAASIPSPSTWPGSIPDWPESDLADWLAPERWRSLQLDPLDILAAIGDPMQPFLAGCLLSLSRHHGVLLAGGTQMLAVYAAAAALAQRRSIPWSPAGVAVGTTRWVAEDPTGDTPGLAAAIADFVAALARTNQPDPETAASMAEAPILLGSQLSFAASAHPGLRAYEAGFVKEGVAAGGCAIATSLALGWNADRIAAAIEAFVTSYRAWHRGLA